MYIYNRNIISYIAKAEGLLKQTLAGCGYPVQRSRFQYKNYNYPIAVAFFEGSELGRFNSSYLQIELNKNLIVQANELVFEDVLKHELAHYICYLEHGSTPAHGKEFQQTCEKLGFSPHIAAATVDLASSNKMTLNTTEYDQLLKKIKKLLALAESNNPNEAELATLKANQILLKHNLKYVDLLEESIYLIRVLPRPRKDAKIQAIYEILRHFIVRPVISTGVNTCCLEISGSYVNIRLAEYISEFLDYELDRLWKLTRHEHQLKGLRAKNSFFMGIAKGFEEKAKSEQRSFSEDEQKTLIKIHSQLELCTRMIYRRLGSSASGCKTDLSAHSLGTDKGKHLSVRQGLEKTVNLGKKLTGRIDA